MLEQDEDKIVDPDAPQLPVDLSRFLERQPTSPEEEEVIAEESPTREANGDDLRDLFETPHREDPDIRVDDLVAVSDEDVYGEGGEDMSDLVEVSPEDIMGEDLGEPPSAPQPKRLRFRRTRKTYHQPESPPPSIRGMR